MRARLGFILALTTAALLLAGGASASAAVPFCTYGSDPGQCKEPTGVAVDTTNGRVYVADPGNNRVNVFSEDGELLTSFGSPGSGDGQLTSPRQVAIDDDPTSPNFGDVYVTDASPRVQRFDSSGAFEVTIGPGVLNRSNPQIAVIPGGELYVIDSVGPGEEIDNRQVKVFSPAGALSGSSTIGSGFIADAAVDSAGNVYVVRNGGIEKYEASQPTATLLASFDAGANTTALAVDPTDNLYAAQWNSNLPAITRRDPVGSIVKRFGYGEIEFNLKGLALGSTGDLFGSEEFAGLTPSGEAVGNKVIRIAQPGPGAAPCCLDADLGNTKATLEGAVNPEGKAATYHFEYLTEAEYVENEVESGDGFTGPNTPRETPESDPVGSDFELYPAQAEIGCATPEDPPQPECLEPGTAYRYRLVAENADGKNTVAGQFTTKQPFEVLETYATEAGTDAVRLNATVNPLGIPANAHFEYVDDATYQASGFANAAKTPSIDLGSGNAPKLATTQLSGLTPGATYYYRVVVANASAEEEGPERTVTTFPLPKQPANSCPNAVFRTGPSALLPDCRAYEMVSPVDKSGGDAGRVLINMINFPARLEQSSTDGNRLAYSSATAFASSISAPFTSEYLASRTRGGWSTESLNAPRESKALTYQPTRLDTPYHHFSPDLSEGWLFQDANPTLDECAPPGYINLYRRDNTTGEYEALIPRKPPAKDPLQAYRLELQGFSADGTHTVFRANTKLTKEAANTKGQNAYQLYMHVRDPEGGCGELRLVSFEPDGVASTQPASAGTPRGPAEYRESTVARAVSEDGRRVFFSLALVDSSTEPGSLYARVNADQPQSAIGAGECTEPAKGCTLEISSAQSRFWTAATDGSRAIYSVGSELFEYDVDRALAGETASTPIAKEVGGVVGASEDGSRVYFVSREEIGGEGEAGEPNLYLYEPGKTGPGEYRLVATLTSSGAGLRFWGFTVGAANPIRNGVRLTADGSRLAFVSSAPLTGYDNLDGRDGEPNLEVFHYDAQSGKVSCVSCNPSGARPRGREFKEGAVTRARVSAMMPAGQDQLFAPRALTADGNRLYFESFESLLPRDTNGKGDVYQWQRAGSKAECEANGADLYVPSSGGCLSLISSGQSPVDSEISDVSPDGSNVFIRTAESLLPQDPGNVDIYDVRVGGGFPQPPGQPAACEGEACQGPLSPPSDQTPASLGFLGAGNLKEGSAKPRKPRCAKGKARRKGRCVSKKRSGRAKGAEHRGAKRGSADGDAHRRGPR